MVTAPNALLLQLAHALDAADVRYAVGGSIASSRYGEYRATNDIDVVVEVGPIGIGRLVAALQGDGFHVDRDAAHHAANVGGTFTAIHLDQYVKIDFFVATEEKLHRLQLEQRVAVEIESSQPLVYFTSAEDTILAKLVGYRRSNGVLERQLRDVAGILKTQRRRLDLAHLGPAAMVLGVGDLLDDALDASGLGSKE